MNSTCRFTALILQSIYLIIDICSIPISDSGSIDVSVSGVTFDVGISLGKSTNMITLVAIRAWVLNLVLYLCKTIYNQQIVSTFIHHIELH